MKKLAFIFLLVLSATTIAQTIKVTYHGYDVIPFYSEVWRVEYKGTDDSMAARILPKNDKYFSANSSLVKSKIDETSVRANLLTSFNLFRKDYSLSCATENPKLTSIANKYVKTIPNAIVAVHSDLVNSPLSKKNDSSTIWLSEGICAIPYSFLTKVPNTMDINRVIADCVFDALATCPAHASDLVRDCEGYEIGFGLDFRNTEILVVLQYRQKKQL